MRLRVTSPTWAADIGNSTRRKEKKKTRPVPADRNYVSNLHASS
jgi:hypothetical protein